MLIIDRSQIESASAPTEEDLARKPLINIGELILIVIPEDLISLSYFRSCDTLTVENG